MTRADLKHCGKMSDAREELNRLLREGRIESRHSIKSLEGMGSSSHDLGAELRMHSFTVNCDTFSNEEKVAAIIPVSSIEVTCSEAMLALSNTNDTIIYLDFMEALDMESNEPLLFKISRYEIKYPLHG